MSQIKRGIYIEQLVTIVLFALLFLSALFTSYESPLRYLKYILFPLLTFFLFFIKRMNVSKLLLRNILLYIGLLAFNLIISTVSGKLSFRFIEESLLIMLPLLSVFIFVGFKNLNVGSAITTIFYSYVLAFFIFNFKFLINIPKLLSSFITALRLSYFPTESWMAFPFGVFTLYFLIEKNYKNSMIAGFFFLLSFKRISMFAFIIAISIYLLSKFLNNRFNRNKVVGYFIVLNAVLLTTLYFFINGFFTRVIYKLTGISINHFSQGRFQIYNDVINHFSDRIWLGASLGFTHLYLDNKYEDISYLHSDILKIIIELGIVSFLIWLLYFMYINLSNKKAVPIVLFINILFLSDNVFIYFDTLFVFYLVLVKFDKDEQIQKNSIEK